MDLRLQNYEKFLKLARAGAVVKPAGLYLQTVVLLASLRLAEI